MKLTPEPRAEGSPGSRLCREGRYAAYTGNYSAYNPSYAVYFPYLAA